MLDSLSVAADPGSEPARPAKLRRRSARQIPSGYISIGDLAALGAAPRSTLYHYVRCGRLAAALWRGRIIVREDVALGLLAAEPQPLHAVADADKAAAHE